MCPIHPFIKPIRSTDLVMQPTLTSDENCNREISRWLERYRNERAEKTPGKDGGRLQSAGTAAAAEPTDFIRKPKTKRGLTEELEQQENSPMKRRRLESQAASMQHYPQQPQMQLFAHPPLNLLPSLVPQPQQQHTAPKSPMKNFPLALISQTTRSLLEERLKTSPPRKQLSDITSANNEQDVNEVKRNALNVLLVAAAAGGSTVVQPKSPPPAAACSKPASGSPVAAAGRFRLMRTPPRSPMKNLKPKKRWARAVFQEEGHKRAVKRISDAELPDDPASSSPPSASNEEDSLAQPIRWTEADSQPAAAVFRRSTTERTLSPDTTLVATALVEMSSESDANLVSSEPDNHSDRPLNLSIK